jgi:hypothetical protein
MQAISNPGSCELQGDKSKPFERGKSNVSWFARSFQGGFLIRFSEPRTQRSGVSGSEAGVRGSEIF